MTRSKLLKSLRQRFPHLMPSEIAQFTDVVFGEWIASIAAHKRVELRGFGIFTVRTHPPRLSKIPNRPERLLLEPRVSIGFKAGKRMQAMLEQVKTEGQE